jgi:hypothetical protein
MRYAPGLIPTVLVVVAATATVIACSGSGEDDGATQSALNAGNNPPGNNGTCKIQEVGDNVEIPDNDPHVGCKFQIEFRGYDKDVGMAKWKLEGQAPTGKDIPVLNDEVDIGQDSAGGANDLDAIVLVDLTDKLGALEPPHPNQGFHLKLTVNAPGSQGSDVKHKVFWVHGCTTPPPDGGTDGSTPPDSSTPPDGGPVCGNGVKEGTEQCDLGEENGEAGSHCTIDCKNVPFCGDGHVDMGEDCDLGMDNGKPWKNCTADCKFPPPKMDAGQTW